MLLYLFIFFKTSGQFPILPIQKVGELLLTYIHFPKYQLASNFLRTFYIQAPVFIFGYYFGTFETGQYAIAYLCFGVACAIFVDSYSNFHLVQMGQLLDKKLDGWQTYYKKMLLRCLRLSISIGLLILLFGKWSILLVFGAEWAMAGTMFQSLSLLFLSYFMYAFNFHIFTQLQQQKQHLLFNTLRVGAVFLVLLIIYRKGIKANEILLIFGIIDLVITLGQTLQARKILHLTCSKSLA